MRVGFRVDTSATALAASLAAASLGCSELVGSPTPQTKQIELIDPPPAIASVIAQRRPDDPFSCYVNAVSRDGSVAVGAWVATIGHPGAGSVQKQEAFRWSKATGVEGLGLPLEANGEARMISADGAVIVGQSGDVIGSPDSRSTQAFKWTQDSGPRPLAVLPDHYRSVASGMNADGSIVAGDSGEDDTEQAVLWTSDRGLVAIGGALPGTATFVGAGGSVVAGEIGSVIDSGFNRRVFRWTESTGFALVRAQPSEFVAASADGAIIVGNGIDIGAFRWSSQTGDLDLGSIGVGGCWAAAASADGSVITGSCGHGEEGGNGVSQAFRWTQATGVVPLGFLLGGSKSFAQCMSADGSVITGQSTARDLGFRTFVWTPTAGMRDLGSIFTNDGLDGWTFESACVSANGRVVYGSAFHPTFLVKGYVATLP